MDGFIEAARDLAYMRCALVNVAAIGNRSRWVLIDAGLQGYGPAIRRAAEARFGAAPPEAIVLTHGHFDHVGSLEDLLSSWDVPVYAHALEMPYLTGRSPYPPPDPLVGRGSLALLSRLYPRGPIDLGARVQALASEAVPGAPEWRWIRTPGHTPGHISLFRASDRTLLSGDAVITTRQESLAAVLAQRCELHGPPAYYTPDWDRARDSVRALAHLAPEVLVAGHGRPWVGPDMRRQLDLLARRFDELERPRFGRYVKQPATANEYGVIMLPRDPLPAVLAGAGAMIATAGVMWVTSRRQMTSGASH